LAGSTPAPWPAPAGVAAAAGSGEGTARWLAWITALVVASGAAAALGLAALSLRWPLVHDAPLMHYVAWLMTMGAVPYRDVFDMNFPGVYLVHLLVVRVLGVGDLAWRLFDLGWLVVTAALLACFARPWGRGAAIGASVLFALHHLAGGAWQAGQRDFLLCPLLVAGALGVARWLESRRRGSLAWGGLALGASVTIKPHALALVGALALTVALAAWRRGADLGAPGLFVASALAAPLAVIVWLAAAGALPAWRAIVLDYLIPLYSRLGRDSVWNLYRPQVWIPIGAGALLSAAGALAGRRFGARHVVATLGVLYGIVHFVGQRKGWEYHLYPLAVFAALLCVAGLPSRRGPERLRSTVPVLIAVAVAVVMLAGKALAVSPAGWERDKADAVRRLAAELAPMLAPGERVQVLDTTEGGIHALLRLGVRQPTRFIYDFHFFHDTDRPVIQALRGELIRELDAHPPALIVVFERGWPRGGYERIDAFPELAARLARYDLVQAGPGYRIHAQRHR
jgi:hypothetical protein